VIAPSGKKYVLSTWQIVELTEKLSWIFTPLDAGTDRPQQFSVRCKLTRNLLPKVRVNSPFSIFHSPFYYGPSDGISNLRFSEYIYVETSHSRYLDTGDEKHLDAMIAVMYRPRRWFVRTGSAKWTGDYRREFNPFLTEKYQRTVRRLSPVTKRMILMWYQACTLMLHRMFPDVFTRGTGKSNTEVFESFMDMVNTLSGDDVTRKNAVREAYLFDALKTVNEMVRRNRELEKQIKKHRR
jgi:hypothetical protein